MIKEITVEITNKCEYNCTFCSSNSNMESTDQLEVYDLVKIIDYAYINKVDHINISGGNPLEHEYLEWLLKFLHDNEIKTILYLPDNDADDKKFPWRLISILSRNKQLEQNLTLAFNHHTWNYSIFWPNVEINWCLFPSELTILHKECVFYKNIGMNVVKLLRPIKQGRAKDLDIDFNSLDSGLLNLLPKLNKLVDDNFKIELKGAWPGHQCISANKLVIKPTGDCVDCEALKNVPKVLGNIKTETLDEIVKRKINCIDFCKLNNY